METPTLSREEFLALYASADAESVELLAWMNRAFGEQKVISRHQLVTTLLQRDLRPTSLYRAGYECQLLVTYAFTLEEALLRRKWRELAVVGRLKKSLVHWNRYRHFLHANRYSPILYTRAMIVRCHGPLLPHAVISPKAEELFCQYYDRQLEFGANSRERDERIAMLSKLPQDFADWVVSEYRRGKAHIGRLWELPRVRDMGMELLIRSECACLPCPYLITLPFFLDWVDARSLDDNILERVFDFMERVSSCPKALDRLEEVAA